MKRTLALLAAIVALAGCGSGGSRSDTQQLPAYRPNSNQTGDQGY